MKPAIALQLWSIKDDCERNFDDAIKKVRDMGYDGVEFAGYYGKTADEINQLLTDTGLGIAGSHVPYEHLREALDETLDFEKAIGNTRVVVPFASFQTLEGWEGFANDLNRFSQSASKRGIELYYHNHAHEFSDIENQDMLSFLNKNVESLYYEVDLYWLSYAGINEFDWVDAHKEAIGLFHFKDKQVTPVESTELGAGVLPIKKYVEKAKELHMPWLIVEQEAFQTLTPLEAAHQNVNKLKELVEEVHQ